MDTDTAGSKASPAKRKVPTEIVVYKDWCKACGLCIEFCPKHVLEAGTGGYPLVAHPYECISCDLCELLCPDFAITLTRDEDEPKHREE